MPRPNRKAAGSSTNFATALTTIAGDALESVSHRLPPSFRSLVLCSTFTSFLGNTGWHRDGNAKLGQMNETSSMPPRLQAAQSALKTLSAGNIPDLHVAESAASALLELEEALRLDDGLLRVVEVVRLIAKGETVPIDHLVQEQAQRLSAYIADLAH